MLAMTLCEEVYLGRGRSIVCLMIEESPLDVFVRIEREERGGGHPSNVLHSSNVFFASGIRPSGNVGVRGDPFKVEA